jgi:hypothetical protein
LAHAHTEGDVGRAATRQVDGEGGIIIEVHDDLYVSGRETNIAHELTKEGGRDGLVEVGEVDVDGDHLQALAFAVCDLRCPGGNGIMGRAVGAEAKSRVV